MCGIAGFNWRDEKLMKSMLDETRHRGPDDSGSFFDRCVSLGHNRLSIIDISKAGRQPMCDEKEDVWITFNGEIYNHLELKDSLKGKYKFKSKTDTEVLIYLYKEFGKEMLSRLQGMFSFCIYDKKNSLLFLARDRLGIKPLYYHASGRLFLFCSELKGLLKYKNINREINKNSLSSYFTFRANTNDETLIQDVMKLAPGNYVVYSIADKKIKVKKYWDVKFKKEDRSFESYAKELTNLLTDSVKKRLMSDVPYGAYLSGGIDSGLIVSLMSSCSNSSKPIKTFSVGFKEERYSEVDEARFLAKKLKTDHHELLIDNSCLSELPNIIYQGDEPMADPTAIPTYFLSKYAKKYCTVILTGEGADELFGGYPQYNFIRIRNNLLRKIPSVLKNNLPSLSKFVPSYFKDNLFRFSSDLGEKGLERFSNFLRSNKPEEQYLSLVSIFDEKEQKKLGFPKIEINSFDSLNTKNESMDSLISSYQLFELKNQMVDDLLMKLDKNTMAFGVEGRVPFLDHRVVEIAAKIPLHYKLNYFKNKIILREVAQNFIPEETRKRKKKHFFVPIISWIENELMPLSNRLLSEKFLRKQKIFNYNYIKEINENFSKSKLFYARQLWALLVFQIWYKQYIEHEKI